jgi:tRNA pseudouridine32 synthase/23S rRNA pseudouridine746 synthase
MSRPSRLYLPKLQFPPPTIFEHLLTRFPQIPAHVWRARLAHGLVTLSDGAALHEDSLYQHGLTVFYRREVPQEPDVLDEPCVIYQDEEILVVDKPHGMPVTPVGEYLERSLLVWLERRTGLSDLAAMHRLDQDTAGLLLFTIKPSSRAQYHSLFMARAIEREYIAIAYAPEAPNQTRWRVENRLKPGNPWFRQQIVEGHPNALTNIELLERRGTAGLFRIAPETGKKHQLRVHMASIGFPIVGDPYYPKIRKRCVGDSPMQLLARRLTFVDPFSAIRQTFTSSRELVWPDGSA